MLLDKDSESARGRVIERVIIELYQTFLPTIIQPGDIFIYNRTSIYTAHITRAMLQQIGIIIIK